MIRLLITVLYLTLLFSSQLFAQEITNSVSYQGVAELLPMAARLEEESIRDITTSEDLNDIEVLKETFDALTRRQQQIEKRLSELGEPETWTINRLLEIRDLLIPQRDAITELVDNVSTRLSDLDEIRKDWAERKDYWKGWRTSLQESRLSIQDDVFNNARETIDSVLKEVSDATQSLVALQKEAVAFQESISKYLARLEVSLTALRVEIFKKTALSFFDVDYYRQFSPQMWKAVKIGASQVQKLGPEFFKSHGLLLAIQVLVVIGVWGFVRYHRERTEVTDEWLFLMRHPFATGTFVAVAGFSFFYDTVPPLWGLFLWFLAAFSASILVSGLLKNPRKIFMVFLLASLFIVSLTLKMISFPAPLYRLYLTLLCLSGVPFLLKMAASNVRFHAGRVDGFTTALRIGAAVLFVSLLAQIAGFSTLASRIIESSVETVFLGLLLAMALRLGRGGIDFLTNFDFLRRYRFFRRSGAELSERLKGVYRVIVGGYALLYLLQVWGIYDTTKEAWEKITNLGFTVGGNRISLTMLLTVALVIYVSFFVSWFIKAFLDYQIFYGRQIDRGVRDSIKKLLHYTLILFGFLLALSFAGVELRNLVVVAGAFGIGIGFGLQNIVNNFVSGIILLFERPVKVGDVVVLDGEWGTIRKIGLRSTVVETLDQAEIIVPNSQFISDKVTNWTLSSNVTRIVIPVGVAYGSDVELVISILREVAEGHPDVLKEPLPSPIFTGFGESSLDFELRVWIADVSTRLRIKSELGQAIDAGFRKKGVEIPFPQRDLHLRSVKGEWFEKLLKSEKTKKGE